MNLESIHSLYGNDAFVVEISNACDKAYAVGTGNPSWHTPFDAEKPQYVAISLAGAVAVVSGISIIALLRGKNLLKDDGTALEVLQDIADGSVSELEKQVLLRLANATWNAAQPFRDMESAPLARVKNMNSFDLLPPDEVAKDWYQIKTAAEVWLKHLD